MDQTFNQITATDPADRPTGTAGARIVALLAVLGGAGLLVAMVTMFGALLRTPPLTWAGLWADPVLGVVMFVGATGGFIALCVALAGLGLAIGPARDPRVASVAALGAIGGASASSGFPSVSWRCPRGADRRDPSGADRPAPDADRRGPCHSPIRLDRGGRALGPERIPGVGRSDRLPLSRELDRDRSRALPWPAVQESSASSPALGR